MGKTKFAVLVTLVAAGALAAAVAATNTSSNIAGKKVTVKP